MLYSETQPLMLLIFIAFILAGLAFATTALSVEKGPHQIHSTWRSVVNVYPSIFL